MTAIVSKLRYRWKFRPSHVQNAIGKSGNCRETEGAAGNVQCNTARLKCCKQNEFYRVPEIESGCRAPTETLSIPTEPSALARPSGERRRRSGVAIPMVSQSERATAAMFTVNSVIADGLFVRADFDAVALRQRASPSRAETRHSRGSVVTLAFERHDSTRSRPPSGREVSGLRECSGRPLAQVVEDRALPRG